jgi:hypothetical protein
MVATNKMMDSFIINKALFFIQGTLYKLIS